MPRSLTAQLKAAASSRKLVRLTRRFEDSTIIGYVLAVGARFFLLALVNDRIRFDGFECFRIKDLLSIEADPYADFAEAALRKRGEKKPRKPKINLDSVEDLLVTAGKTFPLITIHMEKSRPDVCYIGRVHELGTRKVALQCITPHAQWESTASKFPLAKITRLNFGGDYEEALYLVGGEAAA